MQGIDYQIVRTFGVDSKQQGADQLIHADADLSL
jgi:hypothetical protein